MIFFYQYLILINNVTENEKCNKNIKNILPSWYNSLGMEHSKYKKQNYEEPDWKLSLILNNLKRW